jgi:hypothetical protein
VWQLLFKVCGLEAAPGLFFVISNSLTKGKMAYINKQGYLERRTRSGKHPGNLATKRIWWFAKYNAKGTPSIDVGELNIRVPEELLGKRLCLKLVEYEDTLR